MKKFILCIAIILTCATCFSACKKNPNSSSSSASESVSEGPSYTIELSHNEVALVVGESFQLDVEVSKENVYVFWSVRDENIATVTDDGLITAVAEGQTICYAEFGGQAATCLIKVSPKPATPLLSVSVPYINNSATIIVGDTLDVKATVKLGDTELENVEVEYIVTGSAIAVSNGVITALEVGESTIVVEVSYEGQVASLELAITVIEY